MLSKKSNCKFLRHGKYVRYEIKINPSDKNYPGYVCNIRPNTTQRRSVEKVPNNDWQASVTLILLVFHRLDLAS